VTPRWRQYHTNDAIATAVAPRAIQIVLGDRVSSVGADSEERAVAVAALALGIVVTVTEAPGGA
jgi:hypothetical protein